MKIIHVLNTGSYSGAEKVAITIINKMKQKNDIVYVALEGSIRNYLEESKIKFEPIKKVSIKEIRKVIKKYNPDIIHAHDFTTSVICALASKKKKIISHIHNNASWIKKINIYSISYLLSSMKYNKILVVSKSIIEEYKFKKAIKKKTQIIGNPIDIQEVKNKAEQENTEEKYDIIFIGRLTQEKNPQGFIELINELNKKIKVKAAILGEGILKETCRKEIEKCNLQNVITMKGFVENPYAILKNAKILCMTSKWEGYGMVAIEALTLGVPVVATKVGGIPDIVTEQCGKTTNNTKEILQELTLLLQNEEYYKKKSLKSIKRAQEMNNIDEYIKNLNDIYYQCMMKGE